MTVRPLFKNQNYSTNSTINYLENWDTLSKESKATDTFNELFSNIKPLQIEKDDNSLFDVLEETKSVLKAIKK